MSRSCVHPDSLSYGDRKWTCEAHTALPRTCTYSRLKAAFLIRWLPQNDCQNRPFICQVILPEDSARPIHLSCNNTISEVRNSPIFNIQLLFISYRISLHSRFSQTRAIWLFYNHCPTRVTVVAELSTIEVRRLKRRFIRRPSSFHKHHPFLVNAAHYAAELGNIAIGSVTSVS